jgi:hypothetical protein
MSCVVCLAITNADDDLWTYQCRAVAHFMCAMRWAYESARVDRNHIPQCPNCRVCWSGDDSQNLDARMQALGLGVQANAPFMEEPMQLIDAGMCPNIVPLCCNRVGEPPNFNLMEDRRMSISFGNDASDTMWLCMSCGIEFKMNDCTNNALSLVNNYRCPVHGRERFGIVVDVPAGVTYLTCLLIADPLDTMIFTEGCPMEYVETEAPEVSNTLLERAEFINLLSDVECDDDDITPAYDDNEDSTLLPLQRIVFENTDTSDLMNVLQRIIEANDS